MRERATSIPERTKAEAKDGYTAERVSAPEAAVAECPEGKELEEGVLTRGAISVSEMKGRARLNRNFTPSATVQEIATAAQGTSRCEGSRPVIRKARAAITPHKAPAFPAMVKARISEVNGLHLKRKIARNIARSRFLIPSTSFFTFHRSVEEDRVAYFTRPVPTHPWAVCLVGERRVWASKVLRWNVAMDNTKPYLLRSSPVE